MKSCKWKSVQSRVLKGGKNSVASSLGRAGETLFPTSLTLVSQKQSTLRELWVRPSTEQKAPLHSGFPNLYLSLPCWITTDAFQCGLQAVFAVLIKGLKLDLKWSFVFTETHQAPVVSGPKSRELAAGKWEASGEHLPTDELAVHSILFISAGERNPATNHCTNDVHQPCQPSCKRKEAQQHHLKC